MMITGLMFRDGVISGSNNIANNRQAVDALNIFPVPDGDTGTNMSMTIGAAAKEMAVLPENCTVEEASARCASALLRGARGNSGVILSLIFRGFSKALRGMEEADGAAVAAAFRKGVDAAYKAVMKPTEGTILTVIRKAAEAAEQIAASNNDAWAVCCAAMAAAEEALAKTPEQLPVLKKAGVVDAGGKGYLLILEGMLAELRGEPIPENVEEPETHKEKADFNAMAQEEITFTFDTVYVVRKAREDIDLMPLRAYLSSIGDSLVIGEDDETFKVHVHTDIPGAALTESQKYGTLELAKIENMRSQADALAAGQTAQSTDDLDAIEEELENGESGHKVAAPEKAVGFLAICAGDGLAAVFRDLGCDAVVSGGQTMNPSTESILAGIDQVPAETVFVLPNNGNIIMAAQQCQGLTEKNVVVIPSKTVPQGITAMMNVDFDAPDAQTITDAMTGSLSSVTTAQITYAARDSDFDGFAIKEGDYLALEEGKLFDTDDSLDTLLHKLAEDAAGREASFISLYFGEDVQEADAQKAGALFEEVCPGAEVAVLSGGQPVYYYIISME